MVTENVIKRLVEKMMELADKLCCRFEQWFHSPKDEAFDILLARPGSLEGPRQLLRSGFQDAQDKAAVFLSRSSRSARSSSPSSPSSSSSSSD